MQVCQNGWISSPNNFRGENRKFLKPPASFPLSVQPRDRCSHKGSRHRCRDPAGYRCGAQGRGARCHGGGHGFGGFHGHALLLPPTAKTGRSCSPWSSGKIPQNCQNLPLKFSGFGIDFNQAQKTLGVLQHQNWGGYHVNMVASLPAFLWPKFKSAKENAQSWHETWNTGWLIVILISWLIIIPK